MPKIDDSIKSDVVRWSAFYEHRIKTGSKVIFHLEAFVAKFMRLYEGYVCCFPGCRHHELTRHSNLMGMDMDEFDD